MALEATLTLRQPRTDNRALAGVALRRDRANYWHLALVLAHLAYKFDNRAVISGLPALDCLGLVPEFDDFQVRIGQTAEPPARKSRSTLG